MKKSIILFVMLISLIIYRIDIIDLNNNIQKNIPEVRVQAGTYEHAINLQRGNYIVACCVNGKMYSKKITVK